VSHEEQKTLRRRATNREALEERAQRLFTVPVEMTAAAFAALGAPCVGKLTPLYSLQAGQRVLNKPVGALDDGERYDILGCVAPANGIRLLLVGVDNVAGKAMLEVHFYNRNHLRQIVDRYKAVKTPPGPDPTPDPKAASNIFHISGGHRLPAGAGAGQVQVHHIELSPGFNAAAPTALLLTVKPVGDYSTYTLSLNTSAFPTAEPVMIDPVFNDIDFKFRPGCFNNCAPEWKPGPRPSDEPAIDYLAKDYDSFRHTMIAAMSERVPGWQPSSEADLDQVLLELFSAAADELSDYQDRVMNEAYLATARKRVSLARHARLMDYHIHQGNQASTLLACEVDTKFAPGTTLEHYLAGDLKVWAGTERETNSSVVFLTNARRRVHDLVNRLGLYTWGDAVPTLLAGDTTADLLILKQDGTALTDEPSAKEVGKLIRAGAIDRLLIQEHLNPATGTPNGLNPEKRQLLRLLPGAAGAVAMNDPTNGQWFVRVRWDERDALRTNYCFTVECDAPVGKVRNVSMLHGNLAEVSHGRRAVSIFKEPGKQLNASYEAHFERLGRYGTLCTLPAHPLAYRDTEPGGDVPPRSTLRVLVAQPGGGIDEWDEVPSLIHSADDDENGDHYVVETDEEGWSYIRFGSVQSRNGKALPEGALVACSYQAGEGPAGNIGRDKLNFFDPTDVLFFEHDTLSADPEDLDPDFNARLLRCWNPFDLTSGRAPEPAAEIIRRAPEAYRTRQLRAVTLQDYVRRAEELPEVSRAAARYAWTGSWRTVQLTVDPAGTTALPDALRRRVARYLDAVRLIGEDLEVRPPRFVPLDILVKVCAQPDFWRQDLQSVLEQEFSDGWTPDGRMGFFHPDRWTFGQPLRGSQIVGRALAVYGVEHVISVRVRRWNEPSFVSDEITNLGHNEIIQVMSDPDHLELGFIHFEVHGGRQ
jgi:hypothetical protein